MTSGPTLGIGSITRRAEARSRAHWRGSTVETQLTMTRCTDIHARVANHINCSQSWLHVSRILTRYTYVLLYKVLHAKERAKGLCGPKHSGAQCSCEHTSLYCSVYGVCGHTEAHRKAWSNGENADHRYHSVRVFEFLLTADY